MPDFTRMTAEDGKVRLACIREDADPLNVEEIAAIEEKRQWYYTKHWHKIIMPLLKYRHPCVANVDSFPLGETKVTKEDPLYFHVEYVKPGRTTYCVRVEDVKVQTKSKLNRILFSMTTQDFDLELQTPTLNVISFVHQTLTPWRREPVFQHSNPRHVQQIERQAIATKNMFKLWREDTPETMTNAYNADFSCTMITDLLADRDETKKVQNMLTELMPTYMDTFRHLQAQTNFYPLVGVKDIMKNWIDQLEKINKEAFMRDAIHSIITETCIQNETCGLSDLQVRGRYVMCRGIFMETIFRVACFLYGDKRVINRQMKPVHRTDRECEAQVKIRAEMMADEEEEDYNTITNSRALHMFIENQLKPFYAKIGFRGQKYRDEELWQPPVQIILSNNEVGLKALFSKYTKANQKYLTIDACVQMVVEDAKLQVSEEQVRHAFTMSKMTVVNEQEEALVKKYTQMTFEEFCEMISRLVDMQFKDSELDEYPLDEKLDYILTDLLPLADHTFEANKTVIEEFSDSDDDY